MFLQYGAFGKYHDSIRADAVRMDREVPKMYTKFGDSDAGKTEWLDEKFRLDGPTASSIQLN